jgi:hypothetical protein
LCRESDSGGESTGLPPQRPFPGGLSGLYR